MTNRKVIVTAFLLIAVMILGVGYAAVSDTLNFDGDATISDTQVQHEFDVDVRITAVSEDNATWVPYAASTVEINRPDDLIVNIIDDTADNVQDSAKFQIYNLADAGDSQVIWFKVENTSAHDAALNGTGVSESGSLVGADYFDSVYTIYTADGSTETYTLPAGGSVLIKLVITLKTTPSENYQGSFEFAVHANVGTTTTR